MKFKLKLKRKKTSSPKINFKSLRKPGVSKLHEEKLQQELGKSERPSDASSAWLRLKSALKSSAEVIPQQERKGVRKHETSEATRSLVAERERTWEIMSSEERKIVNKQISRSARDDYRRYIDNLTDDIEAADAVGDTTTVFKLAKQLSTKRNGNRFCQPSKDEKGALITTTEQQLEAWAVFLERKFAARPDEVMPDLNDEPDAVEVPPVSLEETVLCMKKMKPGKSPGADGIPVEQYQSDTAIAELHHMLQLAFNNEDIPEDMVLGEMLNFFKKKDKDNRSNYRALGLLNHAYKIFSRILLMRIVPYIDPKLSDMQAGFREGRGCRDNILILIMTIQHLMNNSSEALDSLGIITYIDFVAAFDSILHSYMIQALKDYGVPRKYCRLVAKIYERAAVQVRIQEASGERLLSRPIPVRRGAIQGDIPSPMYFLVALDKLLKDHGGNVSSGIVLLQHSSLKILNTLTMLPYLTSK